VVTTHPLFKCRGQESLELYLYPLPTPDFRVCLHGTFTFTFSNFGFFLCIIHLFFSRHFLLLSLSVLPPSRTFLLFGMFTRKSVLRDQEGCIRYSGTSDRVMQIIRTVMVATYRGDCMISTTQTTMVYHSRKLCAARRFDLHSLPNSSPRCRIPSTASHS
jgi:hypothetical protein